MKNVLSKVGLDVHKEKVLLALITPHKLATYTALHSSYHIGEPSINPKLLLPCVYDTMIMQFYY